MSNMDGLTVAFAPERDEVRQRGPDGRAAAEAHHALASSRHWVLVRAAPT